MIQNQLAKGLGSWAAPNLGLDAARDLIFSASKTYLDKFNHGSSGYELIQGLLAPSSQPEVLCCAEEALNEIRKTIKTPVNSVVDRDVAAAALLFVIHFELLKVSQENTVLGQRQLRRLAGVLGLHRDQVWYVAFSIASWADESAESGNYTSTLDILYSLLSNN